MSSYAHPEMLVNAEWLVDHLNQPDIRIVEVSELGEPSYPEGHIPGGVHWLWQSYLWDRARREFVLPPGFADLMRRSGITPGTTIILYSNRCQFATYALWTCMMRGHRNVKLLDGSRTRWVNLGFPMTSEIPSVPTTDYPVCAPDESSRINRDGVLAGLTDPDRVLLDGRTPEEYRGERVKPAPGFDHGAIRKGRIPGARHLFYKELLNADETFKPAEELSRIFEERGATPDKDIVSYCRLSHRASLLWFTARFLLGYPRVRAYDGSWIEWGNMVGMPVEIE